MFDEGSGNTAHDTSSDGNDGTVSSSNMKCVTGRNEGVEYSAGLNF